MAKIKVDTIGFTEVAKLKNAERLIRVGIGAVAGGVLLVAAGLKRITTTQEWYATDNEHQKEILFNMRNKFNEGAEH